MYVSDIGSTGSCEMSRFHGLSAGKIWQPAMTGAVPGRPSGGAVTAFTVRDVPPVRQLLRSFDSRTLFAASANAITNHFPGTRDGGTCPVTDPRELLRARSLPTFRLPTKKSEADL